MTTVIILFICVILFLLVGGALRRRFQAATLHWGRVIASEEAANIETPEADKQPRSVHNRGYQTAISPPYLANLTFVYWLGCVGTFVWGFFVLPWYIALAWPLIYGTLQRVVTAWLPSPSSDHYRDKIIDNLESRRSRFLRKDDLMRAQAATYMLTLLKQAD